MNQSSEPNFSLRIMKLFFFVFFFRQLSSSVPQLVSLAFIAAGVILKFFVSKLVIPQLGNFDFVDDSTRAALGIPELDKVTELPFVDDIGIFFLVFGCILFIISFCACCGACCQWRPLLIVVRVCCKGQFSGGQCFLVTLNRLMVRGRMHG